MSNVIHIRHTPSKPHLPLSTLTNLCSEHGPVQKSSIHKSNYTFTYLNPNDAETALEKLNEIEVEENGLRFSLHVESNDLFRKRKRNRVMVRNLSFYASDADVKSVLEDRFGSIVDVHLPVVPLKGEDDEKYKKYQDRKQHRGFGFVIFKWYIDAKMAVKEGKAVIKGRESSLQFAEDKSSYMKKKRGKGEEHKDVEEEDQDEERKEESDDEEIDSEEEDVEEEEASDNEEEENDDESDTEGNAQNDLKNNEEEQPENLENGIFIRNLAFDVTRNDIKGLFRSYGPIRAIYLNKDPYTHQSKGTAFLYFVEPESKSQVISLSTPLTIRDRQIYLSEPLDKSSLPKPVVNTPSNNKNNKDDKPNKADRRNLYLRIPSVPSRPEDDDINIPPSDKAKRMSSKKERNTKLRSPLFFINPFRLSIRNLSKSVTVMDLQTLISDCLEKALGRNMVNTKDAQAHYQASGECTPIEILQKSSSIPPFDPTKLRKYVPLVQIVTEEDNVTSKGFAFVDFTFHLHALAVLRELDNNVIYSFDYALGGKNVVLDKKKRKKGLKPRLIVEFVVENKAKMQKQEEKKQRQKEQRSQQRKRKKENKDNDDDDEQPKKEKKLSRGQKQREKKRLAKLQKEREKESTTAKEHPNPRENQKSNKEQDFSPKNHDIDNNVEIPTKQSKKQAKKKQRKRKHDEEDEELKFEQMVQSYKMNLFREEGNYDDALDGKNDTMDDDINAVRKRWFE